MPIYSYSAVNRQGKLHSGSLAADNRSLAIQQLKEQQLLPQHIELFDENKNKLINWRYFHRQNFLPLTNKYR